MDHSELFTLIGYAAASLTTFCSLPQLVHTFRSKSVEDLHIGALILFDVGLALWLAYGIYLHSWPMILANSVSLGLQLILLGLKVRYRGKPALNGIRESASSGR